ncbi:MAG: homoserine kinase [Rhodocyclaceae bacterium]|nr:homoserine kinase [Rhodocyclaceae bacterium]
MAVYTEITPAEAAALFAALRLGELTELAGIAGGIENTNYFADVRQADGTMRRWVLTIFERLTPEQLPFYLQLMQHLAAHGVPVPAPQAAPDGALLHTLRGKPAAVVEYLEGASEMHPGEAHCAAVGAMLARAHLAVRDFPLVQPNLRALPWWNETAPVVLPHLDGEQAALLQDELAHQNALAATAEWQALPRGACHCDLFRNNVMFNGPREEARLTGFFDYYFAGVDTLLFDLAVALNDWAIDWETGALHDARCHAMLRAYQSVRPLSDAERRLLPDALRAGALRFWLSRLWDWHLPRSAHLLTPHDPAHFERVLRQRRAAPLAP